MTPKEKALELWNKIYVSKMSTNSFRYEETKLCALIAVDEILEATVKYVAIRERVEYSKTGFDNVVHTVYDNFWEEVKQEIEKL